MTERTELDRLLATSPSPFSDAVLPNAFRDTPDVPLIHAAARQRLLELVADARRRGTTSLQVVTGDAGEGKTHLLAWLRRSAEQGFRRAEEGAFALAPIAPLRSLERPVHHVLQETVWRLAPTLSETTHTDAATDSPIEIVLWRALLAIARLLAKSRGVGEPLAGRLEELLSLRPEKYFATFAAQAADVWPTIQDAFVDATLRLPEAADADREIFRVIACFPRPELRADLIEWLGGASLAADRLSGLGAGIALDGEAEAWRALKMLLWLGGLARIPLVLAFDQIEGTERLGADAVAEFLRVLAELYNEASASVLLVFCQTALWPRLRALAPEPVRDRLDASPVLNLKALTPEEGLAIVEKRLEHFWHATGASPPSQYYPFEREQVLAHIASASLRSPRRVLRYFQTLALEPSAPPLPPPPAPAPPDVVRRKLDAALDEERRAPARSPEARAAIAQAMLREVLDDSIARGSPIQDVAVEKVGVRRIGKQRAAGTELVVRRRDDRRRVYLEVSNSVHGKSAASTARRLADAIAGDHADRALWLRESSFPLPPVASSILAELGARGAVVWLREEEIAPLAALEALLNAAAAGDVPVARPTALELALQALGGAPPVAERLVAAAFADDAVVGTASEAGAIAARIREHLRTRCAFEPVPRLAERLDVPIERVHQAVEQLAREEVLELVQDRSRVPVALLRPEAVP